MTLLVALEVRLRERQQTLEEVPLPAERVHRIAVTFESAATAGSREQPRGVVRVASLALEQSPGQGEALLAVNGERVVDDRPIDELLLA